MNRKVFATILAGVLCTISAAPIRLAAAGRSSPAVRIVNAANDVRSSAVSGASVSPSAIPAPIVVYAGTVGPATEPSGCQTPTETASTRPFVQRLGLHRVGDIVNFTVPPFTGSISIIEQAAGAPPQTVEVLTEPEPFAVPNAAVASLITEPNGTVLYDDLNGPFPPDLSTAHVVAYDTAYTGTITLPNTTQALTDSSHGYPAGSWSVEVNDRAFECFEAPSLCTGGGSSDQYTLTVITKPIARLLGTLNVAIYFASEAYSGARELSDANFQRYLATLSNIYQATGVKLGTVRLYDLPAWAKALYATGVDASQQGPCAELGQLFTLSQPGDQLNLFFVDDIASGDGGEFEIIGIDGSIPAPSGIGGTIASGAIVNDSDLASGICAATIDFGTCGADEIAYISAHEGGHYMGLYHTSEALGNYFDPLSDTAQCQCSTACLDADQVQLCSTGQLYMTADLCSQPGSTQCGGADNLMFWLLQPPYSKGNFSQQQGKVMRANPVVRAGASQ